MPDPINIAVVGPSPVMRLPVSTPEGVPDLLVTVVSPLLAIAIRFANLFLTVLVGLLVAAMTPSGAAVLGAGDFWKLLVTCASLSVPAAVLGMLKDFITLFGKLEGKYPLMTGSV